MENMSLWYIDYFELEALEKQQVQGEDFSEIPLWAEIQALQNELNCHQSPP
jgi:hypothetical protein